MTINKINMLGQLGTFILILEYISKTAVSHLLCNTLKAYEHMSQVANK
jgi:hypothetical protein